MCSYWKVKFYRGIKLCAVTIRYKCRFVFCGSVIFSCRHKLRFIPAEASGHLVFFVGHFASRKRTERQFFLIFQVSSQWQYRNLRLHFFQYETALGSTFPFFSSQTFIKDICPVSIDILVFCLFYFVREHHMERNPVPIQLIHIFLFQDFCQSSSDFCLKLFGGIFQWKILFQGVRIMIG